LKLARLAAVGKLKATHVPSLETREYRGLIKYRKKLVGSDNRLKNSIRAIFNRRGIAISRGERTWHTGRVEINAYRKPLEECLMEELWRGQLDQSRRAGNPARSDPGVVEDRREETRRHGQG